MPNLNVCTGAAFGTGPKGELEPANVRAVPWPFSSNPATASAQMQAANGLRYDQVTAVPGGGLWVPGVSPSSLMSRQTGAPGTTVAVGAQSEVTLTAIAFVNASSVQTMAVLVSLGWQAALQFGGSTWMELWGGATLSAGSANVPYAAVDSNGGGTGTFVWTGNGADSLAFQVPPSSTVNVVPRLSVKNVAGSSTMTFGSWRFSCSGVFALIDPSNTVTVGAIASQSWTHGVAITAVTPTVIDSDSTQTFTWTISPALPSGVTLNAANGQISGTPAAAQAVTAYVLTATDRTGSAGSTTFNVTVA